MDQRIGEGEITDPRLVDAIEDLAAGRIARLTPEHNAALIASCTASAIPSGLDLRLAENGFDLPQEHPIASVSLIGLDLAKDVFQAHGIDAADEVIVHEQLR